MVQMLVHHKVADFDTWRPFFDGNAAARKAAGCLGAVVYQSVADANEVFVLLNWDGLENAQRFGGSEGMREVMKAAGVLGIPEVTFLQEIEKTAS